MGSTHPWIGERIRRHREARGWDLRELGRRSRIPFSQIGRWERREADPSFGKIVVLARTFGIEPWRLWDIRQPKRRIFPEGSGGSVPESST